MKIVVTQRIHSEILTMLSARAEVVANESLEPWTRDQLLEHARDADALMVFMPDSIDAAFLDECARLKIIAAALKGCDNFDVEACAQRGIAFTVVPDLLTEATAELALALMLALSRNVLSGDRLIRGGGFRGWRPILYGSSVRGATVGIIGYGNVGQALARLLAPFDCLVIHSIPLDGLLASSDFVVPLLPLTGETFHLMDAASLSKMKPGAFLVNVARGSVVDEEAVADALDAGQLGGYAADTFAMEDWARPDRPSSIPQRLLRSERTVFTPHLGSAVRQVRLEIERAAANEILDCLLG